MARITVTGYPRSGTVWVSRLLGDVLDRPIVGAGGGMSLASREGSGDCIMHAHAALEGVMVVRDPRDVAVSVAEFWKWPLTETLHRMIHGPGPLSLPPWEEYVDSWETVVRYEDFHRNAEAELGKLLESLGETPSKSLGEVVERQSFAAIRAKMERHGGRFAFGRQAQLEHLRNGKVGEWKERFSSEMMEKVEVWNPMLERFDYEVI